MQPPLQYGPDRGGVVIAIARAAAAVPAVASADQKPRRAVASPPSPGSATPGRPAALGAGRLAEVDVNPRPISWFR